MMIIGFYLHTRYQQIATSDPETGEMVERRLERKSGEARAAYAAPTGPVRVGIEARRGRGTGSSGCWRNWGRSCGWETRPGFWRR